MSASKINGYRKTNNWWHERSISSICAKVFFWSFPRLKLSCLVNKSFNVQSNQFKLIRELNSDPDYQSYVILVKIYMSLCQINKSVEVDYYKVRCNDEFRIIIPNNFSKETGEYLENTTKHYTFSECDGIMTYDGDPVFDLRPHQPEINLFRVRLDPSSKKQVRLIRKIKNVFHPVHM